MVNDIKSAKRTATLIRGKAVSYADVMRAIAECDRLGKDKFLVKHGYMESVRYHLRHSGRSYPSKAVLGVAAGLEARDFFGGAGETVVHLNRLGFHVRDSETGEIVDVLGIEAIRRKAVALGFDDPAPNWNELPITPSAYFLSGFSATQEIIALGKIGADVGVAAPHVTKKGWEELKRLRGSDVLAFIDSGAFSEVKLVEGKWEKVNPIGDVEWKKRLDRYQEVADALGHQVYLVAPDRIGSQEETLERLLEYKERILKLIATGARVLVVMHKGRYTQAEFAGEVDKVLGTKDWVVSMPCKKAATTPEEVDEFIKKRNPPHIHLLGIGVTSKNVKVYLEQFVGTTTSVSMDSCWLRRNVGKTVLKDGTVKMKRFTKARRYAEMAGAGKLKVQVALALCLGAPIPKGE